MSFPFEELRLNTQEQFLASRYLKLTGPDAEAYLHSQTTNDVKALSNNSFQLNAILDVTGKLISSFVLCKKSHDEFYIITKNEFIETTLERIEKYHIAEEFEVNLIEENACVFSNCDLDDGFKGTFFFEDDIIVFDHEMTPNPWPNILKVLTGTPEFGIEAKPGELINNTRLDELAVSYSKGCYPGQETVAKIHTRRGAAFKPVLIVVDELIKSSDIKMTVNDKKIGEIRNSEYYQEKTYLYVLIDREHRVKNLAIDFELAGKKYKGIVHYYPYLKPDKHSLAIDLYDHAVELFQNGDNESAIKYFKLAIEKDPKFEDAYESLGVLYGRLEDYDTAISLMEQLQQLNPKCMMALTNLSLYHMKKGNIDTAEKYKSDATLLNFQLLGDEAKAKKAKEEQEAHRLAEINRREGMFKQVLEMDPEDAMANNGMGEIELDRKNYTVAIPYFETAIKFNPKYSVAYLGLAKCLYQLQKIDKLIEVLDNGIAIASKNGDLMPANEMQSMRVGLNT